MGDSSPEGLYTALCYWIKWSEQLEQKKMSTPNDFLISKNKKGKEQEGGIWGKVFFDWIDVMCICFMLQISMFLIVDFKSFM
jgi:hypothetical protein